MILDDFLQEKITQQKEQHRLRRLTTSQREVNDNLYVTRHNKQLISFCCNDFLGLSQHPTVKQAAIDATNTYGVGAGASRLITGNHPLYQELETLLASYKQTEAALVFGSGYLTNIGAIPALVGKGDLVIVDRLAHACIIDGIKLSGARFFRYHNNDIQHCQRLLEKHRSDYRHCLVITEHVFSMDGTIAPIDALQKLSQQYQSWLYVDDAHGLATISDVHTATPDIYMGTFSKILGSYGGYVCGSQTLIDFLINQARPLLFSTGLPAPVIAASIASLKLIQESPDLIRKPLEKARYFCQLMGLNQAHSPIVPLVLGEDHKAVSAAEDLEKQGFLVSAIRPPTVAENTARLRLTFTALHENRDIEALADYIQKQNWEIKDICQSLPLAGGVKNMTA